MSFTIDTNPLATILNLGTAIIDRVIPDKSAAAAAKAQLIQSEVNGDLQQLHDQVSVDLAEAANQSVFVAGWRPFVGWGCGVAFIYAFVVQPAVQFALVAFHSNFDVTKLPKLDISTMMPVLLGMLGLGAMRSWDKSQDNSNGH
jgi:Holin of 3TMs, for gene-transfer release